jgi:uncharacterized protein (DUF697 family)
MASDPSSSSSSSNGVPRMNGSDSADSPEAPKPPAPSKEAPPAATPDAPKAPAEAKAPDDAKPAEAATPDAAAPKAPEKPQILCRKKARKIIHGFAAAGTAFAALPIPAGTSAGLTALEVYLVYFVGKIYGEDLSYAETMMVASGLNVASVALKTLAREGVGLIPVVGWGIRAAIAAAAIEGVGQAAISHFEKKHPGKTTNA